MRFTKNQQIVRRVLKVLDPSYRSGSPELGPEARIWATEQFGRLLRSVMVSPEPIPGKRYSFIDCADPYPVDVVGPRPGSSSLWVCLPVRNTEGDAGAMSVTMAQLDRIAGVDYGDEFVPQPFADCLGVSMFSDPPEAASPAASISVPDGEVSWDGQPTGDGLELTELTSAALSEIGRERVRQDQKWGKQRHPILPPYLNGVRQSVAARAARRADMAKGLCKFNGPDNQNWLDILDEEYAEALVEAWAGDTEALRAELVQTAAVIVNMIETIDEPK